MKKIVFLVLIFFSCTANRYMHASLVDEFKEQAAIILSLATEVQTSVQDEGCFLPFADRLQPMLEQAITMWEQIPLVDKNELTQEAYTVSSAVLNCCVFLKTCVHPSILNQRQDLFTILRRFIPEEIRAVFAASDTCCKSGDLEQAKELLYSLIDNITDRTDISLADKQIILNLMQTYVSEIEGYAPPPAKLKGRGRRNAVCAGTLPPGMSLLFTDVELPRHESLGSQPINPDMLLHQIEQDLLSADQLIQERAATGGASSSSYVPLPLHPFLHNIQHELENARALRCNPHVIEEFERRLHHLEMVLSKI